MHVAEVKDTVDPWFGALARLTDIGILLISPEGELEFASELAQDLLGCKEHESIRECYDPLSAKLLATINRMKREHEQDGGESCSEGEKLQADIEVDGTIHRLLLNVNLVDVDGCSGALVMISDATEKEQLENDLRLASRFRNVGRLYQAMAHDLRTPVASVRLYSSIMRNMIDASDRDDEHAKKKLECLDVIEDAVSTLSNSLQMLLDEIAQRPTTSDGDFDLRDLLSSAFNLVKPQAAKCDVALELKLPQRPVHLEGNADLLKHAILNLAVNAIEAMPYGGNLLIHMTTDDGQATIRVADTGDGISPEIQNLVFNRHYTTKSSGAGIGLHVTRETIERLGGEIEFSSKPGHGTEFSINIPLSKA